MEIRLLVRIRQINMPVSGHRVYRAINEFEWDGKTQETPWGAAAYVGSGEPEKMATGRDGGWNGTANGRTWSQIHPINIVSIPNDAKYDINSQDIYSVNPEFGGGYISYERHDIGPDTPCLFGAIYKKRFSVGEMKHNSPIMEIVFINHTGISFETVESWFDEYRGNGNFTIKTETLTGTCAELKIGGYYLPKSFGWTPDNHETAQFTITRETASDNNGVFAIRNIPVGRA